MNKSRLLEAIVHQLAENLEFLDKAARTSHAEATHESSKAENKYDTRGLEAAYLAGGQARHAREILEALEVYQKLALKDFKASDPIDLTALIELSIDGQRSVFFLGPKSGGMEVKLGKVDVMVITPQSPLATQLVGKKTGDKWQIKLDGASVRYQILKVL